MLPVVARFATAFLLAMSLTLPAMAEKSIWIVLPEMVGAHAEAAEVLRATLGDSATLIIGRRQSLVASQFSPPDLVVTIGVAALDDMLDQFGLRNNILSQASLLAVMVPQDIFQARQASPNLGRRSFSAIVLDQPPERLFALIKRALPNRTKIGILPSLQMNYDMSLWQKEAAKWKLRLIVGPQVAHANDIGPSLKTVLEDSEVILALPDPTVYYKSSLQYILLTAYRAQVPLVAYSSSFVRSGAVLGLYSTPKQLASQAAAIIQVWQRGHNLPSVQFPKEFTIETNPKVAASLGLALDDPSSIAEDLKLLERND